MTNTKKIYGFDSVKQQFIQNFTNNRLHHCSMVVGTRGIGKMNFMLDIASIILSKKNDNSFTINENEVRTAKKLIDSGGHTDLVILDIDTIDGDNKENTSKKAEINVKQVRKIIEDTKLTSSISKNKVLIVDSIDNVNINGQNALLKTLEEPTGNTFILLVCHNINKVINTIISRSNVIFAPDLSINDWGQALQDILENDEEEFNHNIRILYDISGHSVGKALDMIKYKALELYEDAIDVVCGSKYNLDKIQKICDYSSSNETFDMFLNVIDKLFENIIKFYRTSDKEIFAENTDLVQDFLKKNNIINILNKYDNLRKILTDTNFYNLDKKQAISIVLTN